MTMGLMSRRGVTDSVTFALEQLRKARRKARQDGSCDQIMFWAQRLDQLLDELPRQPK